MAILEMLVFPFVLGVIALSLYAFGQILSRFTWQRVVIAIGLFVGSLLAYTDTRREIGTYGIMLMVACFILYMEDLRKEIRRDKQASENDPARNT